MVDGEGMPFADDVFFVEMTLQSSPDACDGEITHNYVGARPDGGPDILFREDDETNSPSGGYAYVTRRGSSELILNLDEEVFVGEFVDGNTLEVQWENLSDESSRIEFQDDYLFLGTEVRSILKSLSLSRDGELLTGTMMVADGEELSFMESDRWDSGASGISQSDIPTFNYLESIDGMGFVRNRPDEDDCETDDCELMVSETCVEEYLVTAYPVEGGIEAFEALVGFTQPSGVPSNGFP